MASESEEPSRPSTTLQALLAARLDQLGDAERAVLECGSVEGEVFHRGAIQALSPGEGAVTPRLAALTRKQLIAPDKAQIPGEDGFRFRHLLIRDAAYDALPKAARADLHMRFADWLESHGTTVVELGELLGYHLEQAVRYRRELGVEDAELAAAAQARLATAGRRALNRLDFGSAANLLHRAAELAPASEVDFALETDLIDALTGTSIDEAIGRARSVSERSAAAGDRVGELCGRILEAVLRISVKPVGAADALEALVVEALPVFEAAGDELALRIAYRALGSVANMRAHMDQMAGAYEQAAAYSAPAGGTALVGYQGHARFHGSTPSLLELLAWLDEQDPREQRTYWLRTFRMTALAMLGRIDEAQAFLDELRTELIERGARTVRAAVEGYAMYIELLAGDLAAAVAAGETGCRIDEELGQSSGALDGRGQPGARLLRAGTAGRGRALGVARSRARLEPTTRPRKCSGVTLRR